MTSGAVTLQTETTYPEIPGLVMLMENTYLHHILAKHVEIHGKLEEIRKALADPCYVAQSKIGPNGNYSGNLCFANTESTVRSAFLHVFVEEKNGDYYATTAMYAKSYHGEKIWERPKPEVSGAYDRQADVLYLHLNEPVPAITEPTEDGLLLRYSVEDESPCGVTVPGFRYWEGATEQLAVRVGEFLHVDKEIARDAIEKAAA